MNKSSQSKRTKKDATSKDATSWVVFASFCLLTFGLIAVTWYVISGLQENSEKMRKYKTSPDDIGHGLTIVNTGSNALFGDSTAKSEVHPKSSELSKQATEFLYGGKYKEAIATMRESIKLLEDDMAAGKTEPNDKRVLGRRYTIMTVCYLKMKDGKGAVAAATKSLQYRPDSVFVLNRRADAYSLIQRDDLSSVDRIRATKLEQKLPKSKTTMYRRAFGDHDEELEDE